VSLNEILLYCARKCQVGPLRRSAFRKFCRRNRDRELVARTDSGYHMNTVIGDSVDNQIYVNGVYEPEVTAFFAEMARRSQCFVDVGCNIGYFSCLFQQVNPGCRVFCIDANPVMVRRATSNLALNGFTNFAAFNFGVSSREEELNLNIPVNRHSLASFAYVPGNGAGGEVRSVKVVARKLFQIIPTQEIRNGVLKVDTEGYELQVFSGMSMEEADLFSCILFELSPGNLEKANIDASDIFAVPWFSAFDHYHIGDDGRLTPFSAGNKMVQEVSVILLNKKFDLTDLHDKAFR